jgi:hypothetical protein
MWGRKKLDNTAAAGVFPRPPIQPPVIHNHNQIPWPGIILALFACFLALLPILWWILVFLADRLGYRNPEMAVAEFLIFLPFGGGGLWFVAWLIGSILSRLHDHDERMMALRIEMEKVKLLTAQSSIEPGRMTEEDFNFARVILAVMMAAYRWREDNQDAPFSGRWRPWSLDSSLDTAKRIKVNITRTQANTVSKWLHEKGIVTAPDGGQITRRYPDLASVRIMLDREFGRPIQVVSPTLATINGYEHI